MMKKNLLKTLPLMIGAVALLAGCNTTSVETAQEGEQVAETTDRPDYRWYNSEANRSTFGVAMAKNLAQQAADPKDLVEPRELGAPNPQAAVGAVLRYQQGAVRAYGDVSLEAGGGKNN